MPKIVQCSNCGKETYDGVGACPNCGHTIPAIEATAKKSAIERIKGRDTAEFVRKGEWLYIPEELARQHPLYGIRGWAGLLAVMLFAIPGVSFAMTVASIFEIGALGSWAVMVSWSSLILGMSWWAAFLLLRHDKKFLPVFYAALIAGVLFPIVGGAFIWIEFGVYGKSTAEYIIVRGFARWAVWGGILWIYVLRSKRLNVTVLRRVKDTDPFARENDLFSVAESRATA